MNCGEILEREFLGVIRGGYGCCERINLTSGRSGCTHSLSDPAESSEFIGIAGGWGLVHKLLGLPGVCIAAFQNWDVQILREKSQEFVLRRKVALTDLNGKLAPTLTLRTILNRSPISPKRHMISPFIWESLSYRHWNIIFKVFFMPLSLSNCLKKIFDVRACLVK